MDKHQSERLSAVSDGEAIYDDVMSKLIASNSEYREQWSRIHLVRDVMQGHKVSPKAHGLSLRVSQALENEPTVLAPKKRFNSQQLMKQAGGFAIAATIAVTAVLTVQQHSLSPNNEPVTVASIPLATNQGAANNIHTVASKGVMPRVSMAVERKLSNYIVNHNEYSAASNMQGMLPYVRIVGYVPTRQVVNEK